MHRNDNGCCQQSCPECALEPFARNHYFTGKLLVERDFRDEQRYYIDKLRHHHQRLHGSGVVCGLRVVAHDSLNCRTRYVCIEPGTAIDCCGREIIVPAKECVDITKLAGYETIANEKTPATHTLQICVKYRECPSEQIPVLYDDCGCDDTACAPNRILESFEAALIVDPAPTPPHTHSPQLTWENTVNIAHARKAVFHAGTRRLYVINGAGVLFPVDTGNHSVLSPVTLPAAALDAAVSADGTRLYVALDNNPRDLAVFDTTDLTTPLHTVAMPGSATHDLDLAVTPSGRLLALLRQPGIVLQWNADIDTPLPSTPSAPASIALAANLRALAVSSDNSRAYAIEGARIAVADLAANAALPSVAVPPGTFDLADVEVARSTGPDLLVMAARASSQLLMMAPGGGVVRSIALAHKPESLVVTEGGSWAIVLERDGADSFLQFVNLARLWANDPAPPSTPFAAGDASLALALADGAIYVPYDGDPAVPGDGGVAIVEISEGDCFDFFGPCPACDTGDCIVLATIANYDFGDRVEDIPPGGFDSIADTVAKIARIDNRSGRKLLPSTQALLEAIECLRDQGGGQAGPQGPPGPAGADGTPGADGDPGKDGIGLYTDLPKIIDIAWTHNGSVPFNEFFDRLRYDASPEELIDGKPLVTIYFNRRELQGIDRRTFRVSIDYPQMIRGGPAPSFSGLYNLVKVDLYGHILRIPGPVPTPHTGETADVAFAFVPYREFFSEAHGLFPEFWLGLNYDTGQRERLDPPFVHIALKGDFVYAGPQQPEGASIDPKGVLDSQNIGGRVGLNENRPWPVAGAPRNPSGNLAQGGTFESWFRLLPSTNIPGRNQRFSNNLRAAILGDETAGIDANRATGADLSAALEISEAEVAAIVKARRRRRFQDIADFAERSYLDPATVARVRDFIVF